MTPHTTIYGPLSPLELDILAEASNIGMGHAATALSQLLGREVQIEVPRLTVLNAAPPPPLPGAAESVAIHLQIFGDLRGCILILLPRDNARNLAHKLLGTGNDADAPLDELGISALLETGNILASAYLNALGTLLGLTLLPSVPTLEQGSAEAIAGRVLERCHGGVPHLMVETDFSIAGIPGSGRIFLIPAPAAVPSILGALGTR